MQEQLQQQILRLQQQQQQQQQRQQQAISMSISQASGRQPLESSSKPGEAAQVLPALSSVSELLEDQVQHNWNRLHAPGLSVPSSLLSMMPHSPQRAATSGAAPGQFQVDAFSNPESQAHHPNLIPDAFRQARVQPPQQHEGQAQALLLQYLQATLQNGAAAHLQPTQEKPQLQSAQEQLSLQLMQQVMQLQQQQQQQQQLLQLISLPNLQLDSRNTELQQNQGGSGPQQAAVWDAFSRMSPQTYFDAESGSNAMSLPSNAAIQAAMLLGSGSNAISSQTLPRQVDKLPQTGLGGLEQRMQMGFGQAGNLTGLGIQASSLQNSLGQHGKVGAGLLDSQVDLVGRNENLGNVLDVDKGEGPDGSEGVAKAKRPRIASTGIPTEPRKKGKVPTVGPDASNQPPSGQPPSNQPPSGQPLSRSDPDKDSGAGDGQKVGASPSPTPSASIRSSSAGMSPKVFVDEKRPKSFRDASHLSLQEMDVQNKILLQSRLSSTQGNTSGGAGSSTDSLPSLAGARPAEAGAHVPNFQADVDDLSAAAKALNAAPQQKKLDQAGASLQEVGRNLQTNILTQQQQAGADNSTGSLLASLQAQLQAPVSAFGQGVSAPVQTAPSGLGPQMQLRLLEQLVKAQQVNKPDPQTQFHMLCLVPKLSRAEHASVPPPPPPTPRTESDFCFCNSNRIKTSSCSSSLNSSSNLNRSSISRSFGCSRMLRLNF